MEVLCRLSYSSLCLSEENPSKSNRPETHGACDHTIMRILSVLLIVGLAACSSQTSSTGDVPPSVSDSALSRFGCTG